MSTFPHDDEAQRDAAENNADTGTGPEGEPSTEELLRRLEWLVPSD